MKGYEFVKRGMDIVLSLVGLIILILITPLAAILIKIDSKGPVFFKAERVSQGRIFLLYKFRTMKDGAEKEESELTHLNERADGPFFKIKKDPRVTRVGKVLRLFWLDELPQFMNVLKGEMTLVGPRPYKPKEVANYPKEYAFLREEMAGITGLSQINGASNLPFKKVLEYDAYYARYKSLKMDLWILWRTVLLLRRPEGV